MVGICCVFDFLDGLVARALNVHSEIGKQLDSLADMVSFGVVPGVMMYFMVLLTGSFGNFYLNFVFPLLGFFITIFSAIRLAKFNIDNRQSDSFIGLPTPANTIFISSLVFIIDLDIKGSNGPFPIHPYLLICITLLSCIALVAPLPLFALKFKNFSWNDNKVRYIFLALALTLLIIFKFVGIPLIIILYIILSIINNSITKNPY